MADFRLTPAALHELEGIWHYTVQQWGVAQAERYLDELNSSFDARAQAPESAPACDHILVSPILKERARACSIDRLPRKNERPSDHAPVLV